MDTIEEPMDSFQSRLRAAMQMRNMSVNMLSSKSGISQNTIYIYLNPEKYHRESCPGSNNLEALAVALDVSMDWLWGRPVALMSWIPVSERLPSKEGRYMVTRYDYVTNTDFIDILWYEENLWWNRHSTGDYAVTAWMPLPAPYGKETT